MCVWKNNSKSHRHVISESPQFSVMGGCAVSVSTRYQLVFHTSNFRCFLSYLLNEVATRLTMMMMRRDYALVCNLGTAHRVDDIRMTTTTQIKKTHVRHDVFIYERRCVGMSDIHNYTTRGRYSSSDGNVSYLVRQYLFLGVVSITTGTVVCFIFLTWVSWYIIVVSGDESTD